MDLGNKQEKYRPRGQLGEFVDRPCQEKARLIVVLCFIAIYCVADGQRRCGTLGMDGSAGGGCLKAGVPSTINIIVWSGKWDGPHWRGTTARAHRPLRLVSLASWHQMVRGAGGLVAPACGHVRLLGRRRLGGSR